MKKRIGICIILLGVLAIIAHVHAFTLGDWFNQPLPATGGFISSVMHWFSNAWNWIVFHFQLLMNAPTSNPIIATMVKIVHWLWNFTITSLKQGWESLVLLIKMAMQTGSAAYGSVHWPWQ